MKKKEEKEFDLKTKSDTELQALAYLQIKDIKSLERGLQLIELELRSRTNKEAVQDGENKPN